MQKCLKCECLYPDYYEKCPVCGSKDKKKWKKSDKAIIRKTANYEREIEEDIYKDIISSSFEE